MFIIYGDIELIQNNKQGQQTSKKIINKLKLIKVFDNQDVLSSYLKEYAEQVD